MGGREIPQLSELRSLDEFASGRAWNAAYPLLWEAGMRISNNRLAGNQWSSDREDIVAKALQELTSGLIENSINSCNQISGWDDCLRMMRHITRKRIIDFYRSRGRNLEDASAILPESPLLDDSASRIATEDAFYHVDQLDPPMPELFRDRFIRGMTIDEIAAHRELNRNTLCTWFAKALKRLRDDLEGLQ